MTRNAFRDVQQMFSDNYHKCPKFIESLNFNFVKEVFLNNNNNNDNNVYENQVTINYISNALFNTVANYIVTAELTETSDARWMRTFLAYFSSKMLRDRWLIFKYNFGERTRYLIDYIIEARNKNNFENADDVIKVSQKMVTNQRFKDIFSHKETYNVTSIF